MSTNKLSLNPSALSFPFTVLVLAKRLRDIDILFDNTVNSAVLHIGSQSLSTVDEILTILGKKSGLEFDVVRGSPFLSIANTLPAFTSFNEFVTAFDLLDDHLAFRTFLIDQDLSLVDLVLWGALKGSPKALGVFKNNRHVHLLRWYSHIENLKETQDALALLTEARSNNVRMSSPVDHNESESVKAKSNKIAGSFALGLPGGIEGQVVTRFPPEPSGYLHIGHAKAAMLNQYFAKMYKGKLIIRFDDTNPSKEKAEFEKTILEDLELLEIVGDRITHTSDYFDQLYDFAVKLIKSGNAYADDTEQMKMRQERMDGIASTRRDSTIEENLARFVEMTKCTVEGQRWCLRAKISVDDANKALRDPVVYRCNVTPHHRTGDKWKVYPTYDFACPIVDSIEGVTHALRTNEYRDRNPQYYWMIDALGLRKVTIWDFSRLSFIYTLLSKRKLRWFVEQGLVRGWDDPRFPTVRGIRRRGLTVEALRQYMLAQGPSQAVVSLEWDSIWALNKKVIDPVAPRFWAVEKDGLVKMQLNGVEVTEVRQNAKHKKNPDIGQKNTAYGSIIYIEQKDAITLMDWGNAIIRSKTIAPSGVVESIEADLHLEGDYRKTEKKVTWLADHSISLSLSLPLVDVTLLDYDYLITKKKLEEEDDVQNFITPTTEFRVEALADNNVKDLKIGDIIQFERKGYYRVDAVRQDGTLHIDFIHIPDGKAAGLASKSVSVETPPPSKNKATKKNPSGEKTHDDKIVPPKAPNDVPLKTAMYKVSPVYGDKPIKPHSDTKMYSIPSIYGDT